MATEETVKSLKELRAELNKELADYESQRKAIKEGVLNPYNDFEVVYKDEISLKYKEAIDTLKTKIDTVETEIKTRKRDGLIEYFKELSASENIDFISWPQLNIEITLSVSEKKYKEQINEFVSRVKDDMNMIEASEFPVESMAEYKTSLNASKSIMTVKERKDREKAEAIRRRQEESERRRRELRSMNMVSHDITKTFNYLFDENIHVLWSDIETMDVPNWSAKIIELRAGIETVDQARNKNQKASEPVVVDAPRPSSVQETKPTKELFTATFEVYGTMDELNALSTFLKSNNINYKNI